MKLTNKERSRALKAYSCSDTMRKRYRYVKVTYVDGVIKRFSISNWLIFRDGMKTNLYNRGLIKIRPYYRWDYMWKMFLDKFKR